MRQRSGRAPRRRARRSAVPAPLGAAAIEVARAAVAEMGEGACGAHLAAINGEPDNADSSAGRTVTHIFAADVPGYTGWEWNVVLAWAPGAQHPTVSEVALMAGRRALTAPEWVPYEERIRPGDLGPTDVMPPKPEDMRLEPAPEKSPAARLGRAQQLSAAGRDQALSRWRTGEYSANSEFARQATQYCKTCAFCLPVGEDIAPGMGVCTNEFAFDGRVVQFAYGCGAHSETPPAPTVGQPESAPFDDEQPVQL